MNQPAIGTFLPLRLLPDDRPFDEVLYQIGDWMSRTGQQAWQILPITPRTWNWDMKTQVASPYSSWGIGLDPLFLKYSDDLSFPENEAVMHFVDEQREWIEIAGTYVALTKHLESDDWQLWPEEYRVYSKEIRDEVGHRFPLFVREFYMQQYRLWQWFLHLREELNRKGIDLIGDLPFYIDRKSPLVWAYQEVFELNSPFTSGMPAGLLFPRQVWGLPLYRWDGYTEETLQLFELRMRWHGGLFDYLRVDHCLGLFESGRMHESDESMDGRVKGPGISGFERIVRAAEASQMQLIAEDLGDFDLTALHRSLDEHGIPGQRVFTMGLLPDSNHLDLHHADISAYAHNHVAYTSTHDTDTLLGYLYKLNDEQRLNLANLAHIEYDLSVENMAVAIRNALIDSSTYLTIIPIQDWLLTTDRLNRPGEVCDWWFDIDIVSLL